MSELKVTDINDIINAAAPKIVELPPFLDGTPFVAKLRRPSMLMLMKSGKIPNKLMKAAQKMFNDNSNSKNKDEEVNFSEVVPMMEIICEASLVEPTMKLLKENDVQLTDEQMNFIMAYSQKGVDDLEQFRNDTKDTIGN